MNNGLGPTSGVLHLGQLSNLAYYLTGTVDEMYGARSRTRRVAHHCPGYPALREMIHAFADDWDDNRADFIESAEKSAKNLQAIDNSFETIENLFHLALSDEDAFKAEIGRIQREQADAELAALESQNFSKAPGTILGDMIKAYMAEHGLDFLAALQHVEEYIRALEAAAGRSRSI